MAFGNSSFQREAEETQYAYTLRDMDSFQNFATDEPTNDFPHGISDKNKTYQYRRC